jgi:chromosome segregation ATPase
MGEGPPRGDAEIGGCLMAENEPLSPKPLVLRVEISAEQASSLAPLLGARSEAVSQAVSEEVVDARILELRRLESDLDQRQAELASSLAPLLGAPTEAVAEALSEEVVESRVLELRRRESDLDQREAEFEADVQFREDRIERWRTELDELEQTLDRRERDLVSYVDQLQGVMSNTNDAWWSRPAGGDGGVPH